MSTAKKPQWSTPQTLFNKLDAEFNFTVDVCANEQNRKCATYFGLEVDGLKQNWATGRCWMNPPYGKEISEWMRKAYESALNGALVVALVPNRSNAPWWHDYVMKADEIRFIRKKVPFTGGKKGVPFWGSVIVVFRRGTRQKPKVSSWEQPKRAVQFTSPEAQSEEQINNWINNGTLPVPRGSQEKLIDALSRCLWLLQAPGVAKSKAMQGYKIEQVIELSRLALKSAVLSPARSGDAPPACPECKTQLRDETAWYRCDTCHARYSSSMERGLYRLPDDRFAAPQTSARPLTEIRERYESSMSETAFTDAICAAYDLGRLRAAPQPVSGDAPKVEEIARQLSQKFGFHSSRVLTYEGALGFLRPYFPPASQTPKFGIYIASKTKHAQKWKDLRAAGEPIISTWIDESGIGETKSFEDLWERCIDEAASAERLVVYAEEGDELKGALVEVGAALASGTPVWIVGTVEALKTARNHRLMRKAASIKEAFSGVHTVATPASTARTDGWIDPENYVAWCRRSKNTIVTCDSDAPGAFKVYRLAAPGSVPQAPNNHSDLFFGNLQYSLQTLFAKVGNPFKDLAEWGAVWEALESARKHFGVPQAEPPKEEKPWITGKL